MIPLPERSIGSSARGLSKPSWTMPAIRFPSASSGTARFSTKTPAAS
jgi:hypothetical protein